jgi:catechol 2,3-dioxygenase-like lactoylglutathione lyase family enzyme
VRLSLAALVVHDYDEAIDFFVAALGFDLVEDTDRGGGSRWVVVRPPGAQTGLLLARASDDQQAQAAGRQTGGRVGFFLEVDDFAAAWDRMTQAGVEFLEQPRYEAYGTVAVFRDVAGNRWDLLGPPR